MLHFLASLPRRLRWAMHRWNSAADRTFHDALFGGQQYHPFTFAYPGYLTIRRFADLTAVRLDGVHHALDLGCGPGEITCELARRFPDVTFTGVDHSGVAIARAREHARGLQLSNVRFETGDFATYRPAERADVVMMFDAFHHLLDPAGFVRAWRGHTDRFVLVEPAGDWLGGWQKTIDLDWIPATLDTIRARLTWQIGRQSTVVSRQLSVASPQSSVREAGPQSRDAGGRGSDGAPVEHRYTVRDLQQFFDGFGLEIRGTIAGLETYPPDAYSQPPLRQEFGRITYDLMVSVDDMLYLEDLDLHAKHWVVYAERGAAHRLRTPRPVNVREENAAQRVQGGCDVEYLAYEGTGDVPVNAELLANVTFRNQSWRPWSSAGETPIFLSYHWLDASGVMVEEDGLRTPLPRTVAPGDACTMSLRVRTPAAAGRYTLAIDLVEEGVTWFSRAGAPTRQVRVTARGAER